MGVQVRGCCEMGGDEHSCKRLKPNLQWETPIYFRFPPYHTDLTLPYAFFQALLPGLTNQSAQAYISMLFIHAFVFLCYFG
jgi:hypothetical protein